MNITRVRTTIETKFAFLRLYVESIGAPFATRRTQRFSTMVNGEVHRITVSHNYVSFLDRYPIGSLNSVNEMCMRQYVSLLQILFRRPLCAPHILSVQTAKQTCTKRVPAARDLSLTFDHANKFRKDTCICR